MDRPWLQLGSRRTAQADAQVYAGRMRVSATGLAASACQASLQVKELEAYSMQKRGTGKSLSVRSMQGDLICERLTGFF
jgi:hypothetical protein